MFKQRSKNELLKRSTFKISATRKMSSLSNNKNIMKMETRFICIIVIAIASAILLPLASIHAEDVDGNLVKNSGFEDNAAGSKPAGYDLWKVDNKGICGVADCVGYNSLKSVKVAGVSSIAYQYTIDVLPGEKYLVESLCTQKGQGTPFMSVYWKDATKKWNWNAGITKKTYKPFDGKWSKAVARVQVPAEGVAQLTVLFGAENQESETDIAWFDNISIKKIPVEIKKTVSEDVKVSPKSYILPFVASPIAQDDYNSNQSPQEVPNTLRMCTLTYSNISKEEAEKKIKELHDIGYNAILTEGQRYLLVDSPDHQPLSDIQTGSLPYPDLVRNTKIIVEAGHKYGMKVYLHLTANSVADYFAAEHPDWMSVSVKDGKQKKIWGIAFACLNNKDFAKMIHQRLDNLIKESGTDGLMVDETLNMYDTCGCSSCRQLFKKETGLDLPQAGTPWFGDLNSPIYKTFLAWRVNNGLQASQKIREILLSRNPAGIMLIYYAMPYFEKAWAEHGASIDVCDWADAVGWEVGAWYKPNEVKKWPLFIANMKIIRAVSENKNGNIFLIDGFNEYPHLYFTWLLSLSQGAHQYGREYPATWSSPVRWEMKHENYLGGLKSSADVAVYISARNNNLISSPSGMINRQNSYFAICNTLTLAHIPYKAIVDKDIQSSSLNDKAKTIIMMNVGLISDSDAGRIRQFVKNGGTLIASAETSLYDEWGKKRLDFALADLFGCKYVRHVKAGSALAIKDKEPLLGNFSGDINHPDDFIAVKATGSSKVLGYMKDEDDVDVPGLLVNNYGKGKVIYFAGHPETALHLMQYNGTVVIPRTADDPPDPKMTELFCNIVKNAAPGNVSVDNLPAGVVVETYAHKYKNAQGIQVHLLNMTGMVAGILSPKRNRITFPDIKKLLPDQGKPIQITVPGKDIRNAFMLSPDFDGLYELPIEKTNDAVVCKLPSFAQYLIIYFNTGDTDALKNLAKIPVRTGQPEVKIIETTETPPGKKVIPKTNGKGETVSASSQYERDFDASKAWDGISGTIWCCDEDEDVNSWWMVDLGRKKALDKIKMQYRNISGKFQFLPISVTVQVSNDGANWTTVTSKSSNVPKAGSDYDSKPYEYAAGADARYLRLLFEDGGSVYSDFKCVQLNEVDMILKN